MPAGGRLRRSGGVGKKKLPISTEDEDDEETLVVSGLCTLICAFVIVCIGAGMATLFFMIHQPDCMQGLTFDAAKSFAAPDVIRGSTIATWGTGAASTADAAGSDATPAQPSDNLRRLQKVVVAPPIVAADGSMPQQCTAEQFSKVAQQLPAGGCERAVTRAWMRNKCSFSDASSCAHSTWFDKHLALTENSETFVGIFVGCNKGYGALQTMQVASKDREGKYDKLRWRAQFLNTQEQVEDNISKACPAYNLPEPQGNAAARPVQVYCLEPVPKTFERLVETRQAMGIPETELSVEKVALGMMPRTERMLVQDQPLGVEGGSITSWKHGCFNVPSEDPKCIDISINTLDHWIATKTPQLAEDAPIHYLSIDVGGHDYEVLVGGAKMLKRVQYLDLTYHWFGNWGKQSLQEMIDRLANKGFVCYWPGRNDHLWRITNCWQDHYQHRFWAKISCVNTNTAPALAAEMETLFLQTLDTPNLQFGEV